MPHRRSRPVPGKYRSPANVRLRAWREIKGISAVDLARRSKLSYRAIQGYERGETEVSFARATVLALALGIPVSLLWDVMAPDPRELFDVRRPAASLQARRAQPAVRP